MNIQPGRLLAPLNSTKAGLFNWGLRVFSRFFNLERNRPFERTLGARIFSEAERGPNIFDFWFLNFDLTKKTASTQNSSQTAQMISNEFLANQIVWHRVYLFSP